MDTPPANADAIEPRNANELLTNTGLLNRVNKRYTIVPTPAPNNAAECDMPLLIMNGTVIVAARMASSCCKENKSKRPVLGLSLTP